MNARRGLNRRTFFKLAGGGIVVFVGLGPAVLFSEDAKRLYPEDFNAYLLIGANGRITFLEGTRWLRLGVLQGTLPLPPAPQQGEAGRGRGAGGGGRGGRQGLPGQLALSQMREQRPEAPATRTNPPGRGWTT
jgi:hypothetical protein